MPNLHRLSEARRSLQRAAEGEVPVYEAVVDNARFQAWSEDQFIDDPAAAAVLVLRWIPRYYFGEYVRDTPGHLKITRLLPPRRCLRLLG